MDQAICGSLLSQFYLGDYLSICYIGINVCLLEMFITFHNIET